MVKGSERVTRLFVFQGWESCLISTDFSHSLNSQSRLFSDYRTIFLHRVKCKMSFSAILLHLLSYLAV